MMGYLAVLFGAFVSILIVTAAILGVLSKMFYGHVEDGVLFGALIVASGGALMLATTYDNWSNPSAPH